MNRTFRLLSFAAVTIAALTSCAKEEFKENAIPAGEPIEVSINGQIGEFTPADATKATAESVVRVTWGSGDKVFVYDGSNASIGTLTVTPDNNNASYAMLSGTITASSASPSKLTLVYVKGATEAPTIAEGKISVDLSNQNQAEVPFVLYAAVAYNAAALTKTNEYISFDFATSVMTVNCTGLQTGTSAAVAGIDKAEIDGVSTACELTVTGSGVTVAGASKGKITRTGTSVFTQSDSRGSFRLAIAADPSAPAARNILVHQGSKVSGSPFTSATLAAGKSYNTVYQMGEYISNAPDGMLSGEFIVADDGNGNVKKVHFSKGNLYYDGSAFKFEVNQYDVQGSWNASHVSLFYWSRDARVAYASDYVTANQTYGISPSETDVLFTNDPADDEKANGGFTVNGETGKYRSLSAAEWQYLFNTRSNASNLYKCGVTVCGKTNCVVLLPDNWQWEASTVGTGWQDEGYPETQTGNEVTWEKMEKAGAVCLPTAGSRDGSDVYNVGAYGYYWSSTADEDDYAFLVDFYSGNVGPGISDHRFYGYSVRLVTESAADDGYSPAVKVTGVSLNKTKTTIEAGATERLEAAVAPADATNKQVNWSSSDTSVATVDANSGEVTGVAEGSAVITATTVDGNFTAVCLVTVKAVPVSNVSLDKTKLALYVGSSDVKLTAIFTPQNATNKAVSWSSDKTSVATVNDQGYVHAVAQGTANITVTTADGNFTAVCRVTVTPEPLTGVFRVSSNKRVRFSKGNLYYDGSNWGFESEQYYFRTYNGSGKCDANGYNASSGTASGHWGLFGWSTSSTAFGMSTSSNDSDYNGNFVDWAKALDDNGTWTTLSGGNGSGEWYYLIRNHTKAYGNCNGVPGLFIAPDNYTGDKTQLLNYVTNNWVNAQEDGIIFLPAAGQCLDSTVYDVGKYGYYWSSSAAGDTKAYYWYFSLNTSSTSFSSMPRNRHYSVRLVTVVR